MTSARTNLPFTGPSGIISIITYSIKSLYDEIDLNGVVQKAAAEMSLTIRKK